MIKKQAKATIPTKWGEFEITAFSENKENWMPHLAIVSKKTDFSKTINIRIHSECLTGDIFHSHRCDCREQLESALEYIDANGGMIIYLRQEGRNIGIINKLKAYNLQDEGLNTYEANEKLDLPADGRDFSVAIEILKALEVKTINLMTNNPNKILIFENSGVTLEKRIPIQIKANKINEKYLETKRDVFGHLLD